MILHGCQAKPRTPTIIEKICPQCGHEIEMFSIDTQMPCEHCGFVAYNDTLSCVQWCAHAKDCVGEEMYEAAQKQKNLSAESLIYMLLIAGNYLMEQGEREKAVSQFKIAKKVIDAFKEDFVEKSGSNRRFTNIWLRDEKM